MNPPPPNPLYHNINNYNEKGEKGQGEESKTMTKTLFAIMRRCKHKKMSKHYFFWVMKSWKVLFPSF
jgi:hypothetical protein